MCLIKFIRKSRGDDELHKVHTKTTLSAEWIQARYSGRGLAGSLSSGIVRVHAAVAINGNDERHIRRQHLVITHFVNEEVVGFAVSRNGANTAHAANRPKIVDAEIKPVARPNHR